MFQNLDQCCQPSCSCNSCFYASCFQEFLHLFRRDIDKDSFNIWSLIFQGRYYFTSLHVTKLNFLFGLIFTAAPTVSCFFLGCQMGHFYEKGFSPSMVYTNTLTFYLRCLFFQCVFSITRALSIVSKKNVELTLFIWRCYETSLYCIAFIWSFLIKHDGIWLTSSINF